MARPPKNTSTKKPTASKARNAPKEPTGPTPAEIVEREAPWRRRATYSAGVAVVISVVCAILEHTLSNSVPDLHEVDIVQTMSSTLSGIPAPQRYLPVVAQFKLDHSTETAVLATARGVAYLLMIPVIVLLLQAARVRGGTLGKFLEPIVIVGFILMAVGTSAAGLLEPGVVHHARDLGFSPGAVRYAYKHDALGLNATQIPLTIGALGVGVPVALASIQSFRIGLLPTYIGYMGVLIGMLFILPFEPTGILRAFWLSLVGAVFVGGIGTTFGGGLMPAWATGEGVLAPPRAPRQPRQPLRRGGAKGAASTDLTPAQVAKAAQAEAKAAKAAKANETAEAGLPHDGPKQPAGKPKAIQNKSKK